MILFIGLPFFLAAALPGCTCGDDEAEKSDEPSNDDSSDDDGADDTQTDDTGADDSADDDTGYSCSPPGGGTRTPLFAGMAVGDLYAPVGISLGGNSLRDGPLHPFARMMGGSKGYIDRLNVKALTLDNGEDRLVIVRGDIGFVSDILYAKVLSRVCEISGTDLTEKLWLSGTHTHSGPDHFYPMPSPFGFLGFDTYDERITDRIADSIAQTIKKSMESLTPAALDATLVTPFDPDDAWSSDRRCENDPPEYKEDRLFLARIDRADGSPLAALVSFGVHGTIMETPLMTSDEPGAVEFGLQKTFDRPMEVMFMQGAAGDMNPGHSPHGHSDQQRMEWISRTIGPRLREIYDSLSPTADLDFEMVHERIKIGRDEIGYPDGEFGYYGLLSGDWYEYKEGAFLCGDPSMMGAYERFDSIVDCNDPSTSMKDGYYGCVLPTHWVMPWTWFVNTTELSNIRLGDWLLSIMPGEPTSYLSQHLRERLSESLGWDDGRMAIFGYSQGHQMYLLMEWDWLQGGYETSMNFWGPKLGEWLVEQNVSLAGELLTPEDEDNVTGHPSPQRHPWPYSYCPDGYETGENVGSVLAEVHSSYLRFDTVHFTWAGGYTGVGTPRVAYEMETERGWTPVLLSDGRPLTDAGMETVVTYKPVPDYWDRHFPAERLHRWSAAWELTADAGLGRYRIVVSGETWDGEKIAPYTVTSGPFEVKPSEAVLVQNLHITDNGDNTYVIECDAFWQPNPDGYRLRHPDYGPNEPSPVTGGSAVATITVMGGDTETLTLSPSSEGHFTGTFTKTQIGLTHSAEIRSHDLQDGYGNTNTDGAGPLVFP